MFGLFKKEKKEFPKLKIDMFDPVDQPITVATGKELVSNFLLEIGFAEDKQDAKEYGMEFVDHLKLDFREVKENFELGKGYIKDCKVEIERIEKEIIELKDKKLKLTDEDEIEEIDDEIEEFKDLLKEEKVELKGHIKDMTKEKTKLDNIKSDKNHSLKKFVIDYVNSEVHGDGWKRKK